MQRENGTLRALVDSQQKRLDAQDKELRRLRSALRAFTVDDEPVKKEEDASMDAALSNKRDESEDEVEFVEDGPEDDEDDGDEMDPVWDVHDECYRCARCAFEIAEYMCQHCGKSFASYECEEDPNGDPVPRTHDVFFEQHEDHLRLTPRGDTPVQVVDPARLRSDTIAHGYEDRVDEYKALVSRGATRLMCETFYLEFTREFGIMLDMQDDLFDEWAGDGLSECESWKVVLGRELKLEEGDEDGSIYVDTHLEQCLLFPSICLNWETVQEAPGRWITRPVLPKDHEPEDSDHYSDQLVEELQEEVDLIWNDYDNSGDEDSECDPEDDEEGRVQLGWHDIIGYGPGGYRYSDDEAMNDDEDVDMPSPDEQDDSFDSDFDSQDEHMVYTSDSDWKYHKEECKCWVETACSGQQYPTPATISQQKEMFDMGALHTIWEESIEAGLNPMLLTGCNGEDYFDMMRGKTDLREYWHLSQSEKIKYNWEARGRSADARKFWLGFLTPIASDDRKIDIVLDTIQHRRLPCSPPGEVDVMAESQVNADLVMGLFPHLHKFRIEQNKMLLDLCAATACEEGDIGFSLSTGFKVLFAYGKPTDDLIDQLVHRCQSPTCSYIHFESYLSDIAYPIQKYWPAIAGKRILDVCFLALLRPRRNLPAGIATKKEIPEEKIFEVIDLSLACDPLDAHLRQIAGTSPEACRHLLPALVFATTHKLVKNDGPGLLLWILHTFGIGIMRHGPKLGNWMQRQFQSLMPQKQALVDILKREKGGKCEIFAKYWEQEDMTVLIREATERLVAV
ncbi:hypothetical protein V5O48_008378 [Marasmius crinis-equi]|uniref:Uncharacterized protein n=1 Tax=Marasmius crinis-equi TaxID=585013 RepID=A0ABR3FE71_9AGAR